MRSLYPASNASLSALLELPESILALLESQLILYALKWASLK